MDKLLNQDIELASSERTELLQLLERMEGKILEFRRKYDDICRRREEDFHFQTTDGKDKQSKLAQRQASELKNLRTERDRAIQQRKNDLEHARKQKAAQDTASERNYNQWESQENSRLAEKDNQDKARSEKEEAKLDELHNIYESSTRLAKKSFQRSRKVVTARVCADSRAASQCLSGTLVQQCRQKRSQIEAIQGSLLKKLFLASKRDRLCFEMEQIVEDADEAIKLLRQERKKESSRRWAQFMDQKKQKKAQTRKEKDTHQSQLAGIETKLNNQISTIQSSYAAKEEKLLAGQAAERTQMAQNQSADMNRSKVKWKKAEDQEYQSFATQMEKEFPAQQVKNTLVRAWSGGIDFSTMPRGEAKRNVLVGMEYINARGRKWYEQESGERVRSLMERCYPVLFMWRKQGEKTVVNTDLLRLPWKLSLEQGENLLIQCSDSLRREMELAVQGAVMRILWAIPAGQAQLLLGDASAIGSFAALTALDSASSRTSGTAVVKGILDGDHVCSNTTEIQQRIQDNTVRYNSASGQMGAVRSLRTYNLNNPLNQRSFMVALLQKFPFGLTEGSIQSLRMMASDCGKWGFSAILTGSESDFAQVDEKQMGALRELAKSFQCLVMKNRNWLEVKTGRSAIETGAQVNLLAMPDESVRGEMKTLLYREMIHASKKMIDFEKAADICPSREERYSKSAREGIVVPIGYWDGGAPFYMIFDDSRVHAIVNGDTGSGKTNLLHVLITNTMLRYAPNEVEMYLIDFKHGTEFRRYTSFNLPNFKAISLCNEPELALKLLQELKMEQDRRSKLFGDSINNLKSYIAITGKKLSRILLIVDELFELNAEAQTIGKVKDEIMQLLQSFALQARAYGIHMVITGQNLTMLAEIQKIKQSCATQIALRCDEKQVSSLISKEAADQMRLINSMDKGACVVRAGTFEEPRVEHTAYLEPNVQHIRILKEIHQHYLDLKQITQVHVMITDVQSNLNNPYQRYCALGDLQAVEKDVFTVGEPLSQGAAQEIRLGGKNLWISGGLDGIARNAGRSLCFFFLLSLVLQRKVSKVPMELYYCNGETTRQYPLGENDRAGELAMSIPDQVSCVTGDCMSQLVQKVHQELMLRHQNGQGGTHSVWLVLQLAEQAPVSDVRILQMLQEIIQYGPALGIQTIIWTGDVKKSIQMQLNQVTFGEKFALEMESSQLSQIIGAKPKNEPTEYRLVAANGRRIRIYDLPGPEWTEKLIQRLRK